MRNCVERLSEIKVDDICNFTGGYNINRFFKVIEELCYCGPSVDKTKLSRRQLIVLYDMSHYRIFHELFH